LREIFKRNKSINQSKEFVWLQKHSFLLWFGIENSFWNCNWYFKVWGTNERVFQGIQ